MRPPDCTRDGAATGCSPGTMTEYREFAASDLKWRRRLGRDPHLGGDLGADPLVLADVAHRIPVPNGWQDAKTLAAGAHP